MSEKKKEVTDLIPAVDKDKETNAAKAAKSSKTLQTLSAKGKPSVAKLSNFTNGKLKD